MPINNFKTIDQVTPSLDKQTDLHQKRKLVRLSLWVLLLVVAATIFFVDWDLKYKQATLEDSLKGRLQTLAEGRVDVLSNWLVGLSTQGNQIIHSDLFRLYASEIDLIEEDIGLLLAAPAQLNDEQQEPNHLAEQLPLMQNLLEEFTQYSGFLSGRIINRSGQSYIATDASTISLANDQTALAKQAMTEDRILYSTAKANGNGLIMELYLPIKAPLMSDQNEQPVAVLQLSKNISGKINEILSKAPLVNKGEKTRLLQQDQQKLVELVPWLPGEIYPLPNDSNINTSQSFAKRQSPREQREVFSLAIKVPQLDWWILQEADYALAISPLKNSRRMTISIATLGSLLLLVLIGALWWKLIGVENKKIADAFKQLAEQIEEQRQFLDSINGNLSEYISLKDNLGLYRYINVAFSDAVGRSKEEIIGLDDAAIFGFDTAKRLSASDSKVIETRHKITIDEEVYLQSQRHDMQISKVPFVNTKGEIAGIISTFRDVTEILANQRRSEKAARQTIEVLAKTVEINDPYLAGHSRLMSQFAVETAKALNCPETVQSTVETASFLSQLGKMFIDPELLQKPAALTAEEKLQVEKHTEHAAEILKEIDFDLPIYETVTQMNEHLDGSGYPAGLKDQQISQAARILAVTNSFCAMVRPRSYRPARPVQDIIAILKQEQNQYDHSVTLALEDVVNSATGEKILAKNI